jgi:hypothetical protein
MKRLLISIYIHYLLRKRQTTWFKETDQLS